MTRRLTDEGEELSFRFFQDYGSGNCSCHLYPPCGSCTHPGNPRNLEESDDLWEEDLLDFTQMEAEANARLAQALQEDVDYHKLMLAVKSNSPTWASAIAGISSTRRFRNSLNFGAPYGNT